VAAHPFLDKVRGSLEDLPANLAPSEPFVLVHFAVKNIDREGTGFEATNVEATRTLLRSLGGGLEGILYGSSMAVYGQGEQTGVSEASEPRPGTQLARSRWQAESLVLEHARARGISAVTLRPRFVLGEGDRFVLPSVAKALQRGVEIG